MHHEVSELPSSEFRVIEFLQSDKADGENVYSKYFFSKVFFFSHIKARWSTDPLSHCKKIISQKFSKIFCQYSISFDSTSYKIRCKADYLESVEHNFQAAFQFLLYVSDFKCLHNFFFWHLATNKNPSCLVIASLLGLSA